MKPDSRISGRALAPLLLLVMLSVPVIVHMADHREGGGHGGPSIALEGQAALDSLLQASLGSHVILNFWATWCTPCIRELPEIDSALRGTGARVAVIAVDIGDPNPVAFREYAGGSGLAFPLVWVDEDASSWLEERFGLPGLLPVTIVLDGSGDEVMRIAGARDAAFFTDLMGRLDGGPEPGPDSGSAVTGPDTASVLHVNVVGTPGDPAFEALAAEALALAGSGGVTMFDPSMPPDSQAMAEQFLPLLDHAYAQACVGDACGRPAAYPEALRSAVEGLNGT
jgi:thiol-disulfide isomerase/thioredoxin